MLDNFTQAGQGKARRFGDKVIAPPSGKHWIWDQDRIDTAMKEGRLVFTSEKMVRVKRYLDESRGNPMEDVWIDKRDAGGVDGGAAILPVSYTSTGAPSRKEEI